MLGVAAATGNPKDAIQSVLGLTPTQLSSDWRAAIRRAYAPVLAVATPVGNVGRMIVKATRLVDLNVGPSISPDGRWIAFLSTRDFFSTDLYVAEVSSGRIAHKLTSTTTDPHFSSLQFIYSAGAWDRDSKRIAIATVTHGGPALVIFAFFNDLYAAPGGLESDLGRVRCGSDSPWPISA
jgi:WD40-like Beta Propeller Repeat